MTQTHIPSFIHFFLMKTQEWKDCYVHRNIGIRGSNAKYETGMKELSSAVLKLTESLVQRLLERTLGVYVVCALERRRGFEERMCWSVWFDVLVHTACATLHCYADQHQGYFLFLKSQGWNGDFIWETAFQILPAWVNVWSWGDPFPLCFCLFRSLTTCAISHFMSWLWMTFWITTWLCKRSLVTIYRFILFGGWLFLNLVCVGGGGGG